MSGAKGDLRRTAAGGVLWTASSQGVRQLIQIGVTAVLARFLVPDDFGLVTMAAVAVNFLAPFNEMGMGAALVQKRELSPRHAGAVFWAQLGVATLVAGVLAVAAPWVAGFFERDDLVPLLRGLCWVLPVSAAGGVPQALALRDLRFDRIAVIETVALAASGALAVAMALAGFGVWSLAAQTIAGAALTTVFLTALTGFNPLAREFRPSWSHLRDLFPYCAPLTGYQVLNFVSRNIDDVLIGKFLGGEALGWYSMAYRAMMYPLQKVSSVVGKVSFPTFAAIQEDLARMRRGYLKSVQYVALVTFPMIAALMILAPEFTRVMFGPGWEPVAPLIAILCFGGLAGSIGTTVGSLFLARGRTGLMLIWEIVASACYVTAIVIGLQWGLIGVTIGYSVTALMLWPVGQHLGNRLIDLRMGDLLAALGPPAAFSTTVATALLALRLLWTPVGFPQQLALLIVAAGIGTILFVLGAALGKPALLRDVVSLARETLSRRPADGGRDAA